MAYLSFVDKGGFIAVFNATMSDKAACDTAADDEYISIYILS